MTEVQTNLNCSSSSQVDTLQTNGLDTDVPDLVPKAPDGGWGWVVVVSSFMIHFVLDGICYAFGILLPSYAEYFNASSASTGALMSTIIGCYLLSGR